MDNVCYESKLEFSLWDNIFKLRLIGKEWSLDVWNSHQRISMDGTDSEELIQVLDKMTRFIELNED